MNLLKSAFLILVVPLFCNPLYASNGDTFGITSDSLSLARSNIYSDFNSYAAKDNPAGLVRLKSAEFSFAYMYTNFSLENANNGRINNADSGIVSDTYDSSKMASLNNVAIGLGIPLGERLAFGLTGMFPTSSMASVYASTKNEVRYLLYDDRSQKPEIYSSLSVKLLKNLYLGLGLFYSVKADGTVQIGMSNSDADTRMLLNLSPELVPFGSLNLVLDKLTLGAFYRAPQKTETSINFDIDFSVPVGTVPFSGGSSLVAFYDPKIMALGATYEIDKTMKSHLAIRRTFWSEYKAPIIRLSGDDLESYTSSNYSVASITLEDSWDLSLGFQKAGVNLWGVESAYKFGLSWHESALPDAPTSLAIVDTNRLDFSLGFELKIKSIKKFLNNGAIVDLGVLYSMLDDKTLTYNNQTAEVGKNIITMCGGIKFEY